MSLTKNSNNDSMKTNKQIQSTRAAFTLIEMVGVLAVIAILTALLLPKVFAAIKDSRYTSTVGTINNVKTASVDYFVQQGSYPSTVTNVGGVDFAKEMVGKAVMERLPTAKIAESVRVQLVGDGGANGAGYYLDGTTRVTTNGMTVIECVLSNVDAEDAWELSNRMDGKYDAANNLLSTQASGAADTKGRVVYAAGTGKVDVYVYITHK